MSDYKASTSAALKIAQNLGERNFLGEENYREWSDTLASLFHDYYVGSANNSQTVQEVIFDRNAPPTE